MTYFGCFWLEWKVDGGWWTVSSDTYYLAVPIGINGLVWSHFGPNNGLFSPLSERLCRPRRPKTAHLTPNRPSSAFKKYVSELTVQGHVSPIAKSLLANENSPRDPIQTVGSVVRMNDRAHAHFLFSPSHRAKPLRQHTVQPSHRRPERKTDLSLGKLREAQFPRERSVSRPGRTGHTTPCAAAGPAGR